MKEDFVTKQKWQVYWVSNGTIAPGLTRQMWWCSGLHRDITRRWERGPCSSGYEGYSWWFKAFGTCWWTTRCIKPIAVEENRDFWLSKCIMPLGGLPDLTDGRRVYGVHKAAPFPGSARSSPYIDGNISLQDAVGSTIHTSMIWYTRSWRNRSWLETRVYGITRIFRFFNGREAFADWSSLGEVMENSAWI